MRGLGETDFVAQLRSLAGRYHHLHPFHQQLPAEHGQLRPTMHVESPLFIWSQTPQTEEHGLSTVNNVFVNHI